MCKPIAAGRDPSRKREFDYCTCENGPVRSVVALLATVLSAVSVTAAPPAAGQPECNYPSCTPGIVPNIVLGSYCSNHTYYVFGVTSWGRLVFCGSPRRYEPRWFRSPEMHGVKNENDYCPALTVRSLRHRMACS